jgi:hypothetical protein
MISHVEHTHSSIHLPSLVESSRKRMTTGQPSIGISEEHSLLGGNFGASFHGRAPNPRRWQRSTKPSYKLFYCMEPRHGYIALRWKRTLTVYIIVVRGTLTTSRANTYDRIPQTSESWTCPSIEEYVLLKAGRSKSTLGEDATTQHSEARHCSQVHLSEV